MHFTTCLVLALWIGYPLAGTTAVFPEQVGFWKGSYTVAGQRVKFFAFTYRGEFSPTVVRRECSEVIDKIFRQDVSAVREVLPSSGHPPQHALYLEQGQVMVLGWVNGSRHLSGWLAADTDGRPLSKHHWLASTGDSGMLDSSRAWIDPQRSTTRGCWRVSSRSLDYLVLQIDATMGRVEWFMDWQAR